jgi:hypothetical protein
VKSARLRKSNTACSLSYVEYSPKASASILQDAGHTKGRPPLWGVGKLRTWIWLIYSLYKKDYKNLCFSFFNFIIFTFTYICIHCLAQLPVPPSASGKNLFSLLFSNLIGDYKKDIVVLLPWDIDSYTEIILPLRPYTCILQPKLVHLCQNLFATSWSPS